MRRKLAYITPILLALTILLAYYLLNSKFIYKDQMIVPTLILIACTLVAFLVSKLFLRDWVKASLLTTLLLVLFLLVGHLRFILLRYLYLWVLFVAPLIGATVVLVSKIRSKPFTTCLSILSVFLVCQIVVLGISSILRSHHAEGSLGKVVGESCGPDVYLVVLDEYPGERTLRDCFDFDNSLFIEGLVDRGFVVEDHSYSPYPRTVMTVPCLMGMEYLDISSEGLLREERSPWESPSNRVWTNFEELGYTTIDVGGMWAGSGPNPSTDVSLLCPKLLTPTRYLLQGMLLSNVTGSKSYYDRIDWAKLVNFQFSTLAEIPKLGASTFTVVHSLGAHHPYVYGTKVEQIQYMNSRVLEAVDKVIEETPDSIIILLSDHGSFATDGVGDEDIPENMDTRLNNFEAFYLPGLSDSQKSQFGTMVNIFRNIFNFYFGYDYELLPSRNFWVDRFYDREHIAVEVTDKIESLRGGCQ